MFCPKNNKECVKHTEITHNFNCIKSGSNACKSYICLKQCWSKKDMELLGKVLDHYINPKNETKPA